MKSKFFLKKRRRSRSSSSKRRSSNSDPRKYNDYRDKISVPGLDGPLITESLFKTLQHDSIPIEMVNDTYKKYKEDYEKKKYETFYIEHENDEWFKEKYDLLILRKWYNERNQQCKKSSQNSWKSIIYSFYKKKNDFDDDIKIESLPVENKSFENFSFFSLKKSNKV